MATSKIMGGGTKSELYFCVCSGPPRFFGSVPPDGGKRVKCQGQIPRLSPKLSGFRIRTLPRSKRLQGFSLKIWAKGALSLLFTSGNNTS